MPYIKGKLQIFFEQFFEDDPRVSGLVSIVREIPSPLRNPTLARAERLVTLLNTTLMMDMAFRPKRDSEQITSPILE